MEDPSKLILDVVSSKLDTVNEKITGLNSKMNELSADIKHDVNNMKMQFEGLDRKFIPASEIKLMSEANAKAHADMRAHIDDEVKIVKDKLDDRDRDTNKRIDSILENKARWFKPIVDNLFHLIILLLMGFLAAKGLLGAHVG